MYKKALINLSIGTFNITMFNSVHKLIEHDSKLHSYDTHQQIIQQGLAPLVAQINQSTTLAKANLFEQAKLLNWQKKAEAFFSELNKNHIRFVVIKGFAYTFLLYRKSNIRPYSDIDVVIDPKDYSIVETILTKLGYQVYSSRQGKFVSFQNSFFDNGNPQAVIDLHWQVNNRIEFHQHFPFSDLYHSAQNLRVGLQNFKTPNNINTFIIACFHYQAHKPSDRKHIWLYDLALLWNSMDKVSKISCLEKSKFVQQSSIVINTLIHVSNTFNNCLEIDVNLTCISQENTESYLQIDRRKYHDIATRLKNINGYKNKLLFLSEYLFQSRSYVKNRFHLKSKTGAILYYPRMWFEDFFKLFK